MTIEEEFFITFDIKPVTLKDFNYNTLDYDFKTIFINGVRYPKITAEILQKLICIVNKYNCLENANGTMLHSYDIDTLKYELMDICFWLLRFIKNEDRKEQFKIEVKSLFEEEGEE